MMKKCPNCGAGSKKFWRVIETKYEVRAKCYNPKCGYTFQKYFKQEKL